MAVQRPGSEIKRAAFDFTGSGDHEVVAGVADKRLMVLALICVAAAAMGIGFDSEAGGLPLTGVMSLGAKEPLVLPYNPEGWFETLDSQPLSISLGGSQQVAGCLSYVEV